MNIKNLIKILLFCAVCISLIAQAGAQENKNFYVVSGEIAGNVMALEPFFYLGAEQNETEEAPDSEYSTQFLDLNSNIIKSYNFDVSSTSGSEYAFFYFIADIPQQAKRIMFEHNSDVIEEFIISESAPEISSIAIHDLGDENYEISWQASDADSVSLTYSLHYSIDNVNWNLLI